MERWLHQHIFKVGWLLTKNFQTTTVLYYTFFLPGVFLYELVYWLVAGMLNVRAERSLAWPQKQEIGELHLSFVRLARRTPTWKATVIGLAPLLVGIFFIWFAADSIFVVEAAFSEVDNVGGLRGFISGARTLTERADFWLWAYITFTISNTMWPDADTLRRWWWIPVIIFGASVPFFLIGVGDEVLNTALSGPIASVFNTFTLILVFMIGLNLVAVGILGSIESLVERITGDSATFKNGKMIVMRREERIRRQRQERERARRARQRSKTPALQAGGPPSVYRLEFPVPGPPGQEPVTQSRGTLLESEKPRQQPLIPERPKREVPEVIPGTTRPAVPEPSQSQEPPKPSPEKAPATARPGGSQSAPKPSVKPPLPKADDDDTGDLDNESPVPVRSSGLRPAPKPTRKPPLHDADAEEPADDTDDKAITARRSPFASSGTSSGGDFRERLEALRQRGNELDNDEDDTDDDELTYEDVEDSV